MSYSLILDNNITYVDFHGVVDALDIVQLINNPEFIPSLHLHKKVIYDFSGTEEVDLDLQEVKRFAILANVEANFTEDLHVSIILSSPSGRSRAEYYKSLIASANWRIEIVDHQHEALALLTK
jgi:hypothetical protein